MAQSKQLENVTVKTFADYQAAAMRTCTESSKNNSYMSLEIVSEIGEVIGKLAKAVRDDATEITEQRKEEIIAELGDVMWGLAGISTVNDTQFAPLGQTDIVDFDINIGVQYKVQEDSKIFKRALVLASCAGDFAQGVLLYAPNIAFHIEKIIITITIMAHELGTTLQEICQRNINKLTDRYNRNMIAGSGDNR